MNELDGAAIAAIGVAFAAGGLVKGVLGIGLPLVVVPVVATFSDPLNAVSLMLVAALSSNVMQARQAGLSPPIVRRFWPAAAGVTVGTVLGATLLRELPTDTATAVLGAIVVLFCVSQLLHALPPVPPASERWVTPLLGTASGFIGGLTGFFGLALVPYLLSLRLGRETFVAAIAMLYLAGVCALYTTLGLQGALSWRLAALSAAGAAPTLLGVWIGAKIRRRVPEALFRRLLLAVLLLIALNLLRKAAFG